MRKKSVSLVLVPAFMAVLAVAGAAALDVTSRPTVAVIGAGTGDEGSVGPGA